MSEPKAWAIDISLLSDFKSVAAGPVQLSLPSGLHLDAWDVHPASARAAKQPIRG